MDVVATNDDSLWYYHLEPGATSWSVYPPLPVTGLIMGVVARSSGPEGEIDVLATDNANLTLRYLWWSGAYNIYGLPAWNSATPANFCDSYDYFGVCK